MKKLFEKKNTENYIFSIKGTHLESYNSGDPYKKLLFPYFIARENVFIVFNSINNKKEFYSELLNYLQNKKYIIINDTKIYDINDYDHVIYYNIIPFNNKFKNHISIIIDYAQLVSYKPNNSSEIIFDHNNLNWHKNILNLIISTVQLKDITLICQNPLIQKVNFVFSQTVKLKNSTIFFLNHDINHISQCIELPIKKISYIWSLNTVFYSNLKEYEFISKIPYIVEYSNIIIADFNLEIFEQSLSRFNTITLIYTPDDFIQFEQLINSCNKFNISVPNYIKNIFYKQKNLII